MARIRPIERNPKLTRKVSEYIARLIADGDFHVGERLPSEVRLADMLKVSRPTVREALGTLEARGLVEIRPRSGVYVSSAVPEEEQGAMAELVAVDPDKIWELLEIRKIMDSEGAALAAGRRNDEDLKRLCDLAREVEAIDSDAFLRREAGGKAYVRFFTLLAAATHNTLYLHMKDTIDRLVRNALPASRMRLARFPEAGETIKAQLAAIMEAIESGDAASARRRVVIHLDYLERVLRKAFEGKSQK
jgi:GntR family transcriptional repressor for pyruvate dehydrogenase complex